MTDDSPELLSLLEEGRRLASQREDLIAAGADPADLAIPVAPHVHVHLCPSVVHLTDVEWPAAEATVTGTYAEQPRLGGTRRTFCERCADLLEQIGVFTPE